MLTHLTLLAAAAANPLVGSTSQCVGDKRHTLAYSASVGSAQFVDLDGDLKQVRRGKTKTPVVATVIHPLHSLPWQALKSVTCDMDNTQLTLSFHSLADTLLWLAKFHDFTDHFIVGGQSWNCTQQTKHSGQVGALILRRVVGASESEHLGNDLYVTTSMARYDEVFEDADIKYNAVGDAGCSAAANDTPIDKHICMGANTADCATPTKSLPLYTSSSGALSATCSNCWGSLSADVFLSIAIKGFKLSALSFGFDNTTIAANIGVDATASKPVTLALDKDLDLVKQTYLLDFKVDKVPFMLYFEVPLKVDAELDISDNAAASFGLAASMGLGKLAIDWSPTHHWTVPKPTMTHSLTPSLSSSASVDIQGHVSLTPQFNVHFDRMFSSSFVASPTIVAHVSGTETEGKVCLDSSYAMELTAQAELDINIDIIDFHKDWTYGPATVGSWSGVPIPEKCVKI